MSISEKCEYLESCFRTLRTRGVIKTWEDFAKLLDINKGSLSSARGGNEKYMTDSLISKIQGLMERQEMSLIQEDGEKSVQKISAMANPTQSIKCVPTIPIHAYRALNFDVMEYFRETHDDLKMSPIVMQFPGTDCYYFVNSDDMTPHLQTNDLLCLSRLPDEARVTNGDICIINTKYQGIIERFVYDEGDFLLVKSTQPRWTDMRIPKEEIFNIFRILGGIRTNI